MFKQLAIDCRGTANSKYWSDLLACDEKNSSCANDSRRNNSETDFTTHSAYYLMSKNFESTAAKETENCPELPPGLGKKSDNVLYDSHILD